MNIIKKLVFTVGLPASGKSTWAKEFINQWDNKNKWIRVNRDDLRRMRGQYWLPDQENLITEWEYNSVRSALELGFNVIVDATNLNPQHRDRLMAYLKSHNILFEYEVKDFTYIPVDECIQRDKNRMKTEEYVGEEVILKMAKKYNLIKPAPDATSLWKVDNLPAIIVDMDGTLAHNLTRGFYEWSKVGEDIVDPIIRKIVVDYNDISTHIIIVSGREDICQTETMKWLKKHEIPFNLLLMRRTGDHRPDEIVKREIYDEHINGKFNVLFVLDDRNKVVKMWRSLGLKCLQVAEGNF